MEIYKNEKEGREFLHLNENGKIQVLESQESDLFITKRLLKGDFNIDILENARHGSIVPALPLRLNFLFNAFDFVSKVLALHPDKINKSSIVALDVGCGPYGIIGQLAAKLFRWQVKYTEPVEESRRLAVKNISANNTEPVLIGKEIPDVLREKEEESASTVILCNPPWFVGSDDKNHEKEISGGEVQFVEDLIKRHQASVSAFCFLIGRKKSSLLIIKKVHKMGAQAEVTKMRQGTKTRYFIGVSFKKFEKKETVKPPKEKCFSASLQFQSANFSEIKSNLLEIIKRRELNPIISSNTGDKLRCSVCVCNRQWANRKEKRKGLSPPFPLSIKAEGSLVLKRNASDGNLSKCNLSVIFGKQSDYNEVLMVFNCLVDEFKNSPLASSF